MELGLATFADLSSGVSPQQRMRDLIEEGELAEQLGLDVFAIGEHHRPDFLISSPAVALAAIAARTERIRLSSAVTVLSSDDPVRVFQQFAELDLISGGRAEIMAGRGSFIESFPLFGYELDDYDELYAEKLELLLAIRSVRARHLVRPPARAAAGRRRLSPSDPGPAAGLGRGRRLARVGRPCRHARAADDARDHRRSARAVRTAGRALPAGGAAGRTRPGHAAAGDQHARVRRRDVGAGRFGVRRLISGDDEPDRPRARLAALGPSRVRGAALTARGVGRRLARAGRREDPVRARAVRDEPLRRPDVGRGRHATRTCCARWNCSAPRSRRSCGPRSPGARRMPCPAADSAAPVTA